MFDVHHLEDYTKLKLIYTSIAVKLSRHLVIWQRIWIFIIKIIFQWIDNAFKSLEWDFYEQRYETFFIYGGHLGFMQIKKVSHGSCAHLYKHIGKEIVW